MGAGLETRMNRGWWSVVLLLCAMALAACGAEAPQGRLLTAAPSAPTIAPIGPLPTWRPALCVPEPESAPRYSDLTFSGACTFHHIGPLTCHASQDDFYLTTQRTLSGGLPLTLYINVERYRGPGTYTNAAEVHMIIQDGQGLFRWSNFHGTITVAPGETAATLAPVDLTPEPGTPTTGTESVRGRIGCVMG